MVTAVYWPVLELADETDDYETHIVCCRDDVALCGEDVSGDPWDDPEIDEAGDCEICVNRYWLKVPCGAPFCRLRTRWRRWRRP
jgi:hypothetical protein